MASEKSPSNVTSRVCPGCRRTFHEEGAMFCPHDGLPLIDRSDTFSSLGDKTTPPPRPEGEDAEISAGMMIGDYCVERVIGGGGMGLIYSAVHPVIRKRVAIKVLNRKYAQDAKAISRFVMEARAVNEIGHYNIVDIFSIGELDDSRNYFIMEYLEGLSLHEILVRVGRLKPGEVLPIFEQLCDALAAAHRKGFVHRDLKPDNIIVLRRPPYPFIKILDFGLAKLRGSFTGHDTAIGTVLGTPEYMAPEQCRGDAVDERTDVYSLGVLLYELLTGRKPFTHTSQFKVLVMQQRDPPLPPSKLVEIPPAVEKVVLTALTKDAPRRYPSVTALLKALRAAVPERVPWTIDLEAPPQDLVPDPTPPPEEESARSEVRTLEVESQRPWMGRPSDGHPAQPISGETPTPAVPNLPSWTDDIAVPDTITEKRAPADSDALTPRPETVDPKLLLALRPRADEEPHVLLQGATLPLQSIGTEPGAEQSALATELELSQTQPLERPNLAALGLETARTAEAVIGPSGAFQPPPPPGAFQPPTPPAALPPSANSPASTARPTPASPAGARPAPSAPSSPRPTPASPAGARPGPSAPSSPRPTPASPAGARPAPASPAGARSTPVPPAAARSTPVPPAGARPSQPHEPEAVGMAADGEDVSFDPGGPSFQTAHLPGRKRRELDSLSTFVPLPEPRSKTTVALFWISLALVAILLGMGLALLVK